MEDTVIQTLEASFYEKILLYNDLLHCFKREREALINLDLDILWDISGEKEDICSKVTSVRQKITSIIDRGADETSSCFNRIIEMIPGENSAEFEKLYHTIERLKGEIETLRKENVSLIDHSLQFLDGMISIITGEVQTEISYDDKCQVSRTGGSLLLSREV